MPIHNWSGVPSGVFHSFHLSWAVHLSRALNAGILPSAHFALVEARDDPADMRIHGVPLGMDEALVYAARRRTVIVRNAADDRIVALTHIVPPGTKKQESTLGLFADSAVEALGDGRHLLVVDLFPPGRYDPNRIHGAIWNRIQGRGDELPSDPPLTLASYAAGRTVTAYVEPIGVGAALPDMPLFLDPDHYVNVPLEPTYCTAWNGMPERWCKVIGGNR